MLLLLLLLRHLKLGILGGKHMYRRLPLDGLANARELGGFPMPGGATAYGKFIRSEIPAALTERDIEFLKNYGLKMVIDFRGSTEIAQTPDALAGLDWIEYINLPMFDEASARGAKKKSSEPLPANFSWGGHYVSMTDGAKPWVKNVLEAMARCDGAVLFHCTTGKDRTGIMTAMLLGLCGVADNDIIADYSVSQVYLQEMYKTMTHLMPPGTTSDMSDPFFSTAPENMLALLTHINEKYGGIPAYIESCGVLPQTEKELRKRLAGFST